MPGAIVLDGHLTWILPLLIVVLTAAFTLYTIHPTIEFFEEKAREEKEKEDKDRKDALGIISEEELDNIEKEVEKLKKKISKNPKETKVSKPVQPKNHSLKENFVSYSNSAEILRKNWRKSDLPRTLEKYNGPVQGYNCGEYSEFTLSRPKSCVRNRCSNKYMKPPTGQSDYIFPGREQNTSGCIKYAAKPHILNYENDVNKKILEYESMNILPDYKPEDVNNLERPQYTYHRRDGTDDPIITDENRFEVGQLNAFKRKTSEYIIE